MAPLFSRPRFPSPAWLGGAAAPALLAAAALAVVLLLSGPRDVAAHASLVSSEPAANASLDASPGRVYILFTERLVPAASVIEVLDADGVRVDLDDSRRDEREPRAMEVSLPDTLPEGAYTVAWRNLSDVDGHPQRGAFVFFIGDVDFGALVTDTAPPTFASPFEPPLRWAGLLGASLLAGIPMVFALVLSPALPAALQAPLRRRADVLAVAGGAVFLVAGYLHLAVQWDTTGLPVADLMVDTTWGRAWVLRMVAAAIATGALVFLLAGAAGRAGRIARWVAPGAGTAAVAAFSLASHAAAAGPVAVHVVHLVSSALWGGGLVAFLLVLAAVRGRHDGASALRAALPRFSVLGVLVTFGLLVSGTYASWIHLVTPAAVDTTYGWGVVAKAVLLAALLSLAAANLFWVRARLAEGGADAERGTTWLGRFMRAEVVLIALAVAAGATIASTEPGRQSVARETAGAQSDVREGDLDLSVELEPGGIGINRVVVDLERRGDAYEAATNVIATLSVLEPALGDTEVTLQDAGDGRWESDEVTVSVAGQYQLALLVQRSDGFDVRHAFRFAAGEGAAAAEVSPASTVRMAAVVLLWVGVAMVVANVVASRRRVLRSEALGWGGVGVFALALFLFSRAPAGTSVLDMQNPIPPDGVSVEAGRELYQANCVSCHGEDGRGGGPEAASLEYPPLDLVLHTPMHPDGEMYLLITEGVPDRGMPPWGDALDDDEVWHLVNFLRANAQERGP